MADVVRDHRFGADIVDSHLAPAEATLNKLAKSRMPFLINPRDITFFKKITWNRALTKEEMAELDNNPYIFLEGLPVPWWRRLFRWFRFWRR